ncbi:MAG: selenocysteine-specific translation elongation factor [Proteobacteria bacterium]|nr:MAG: selenocysteine-specific translation elongation factor [Pseudomonadota bacterium]PIE20077.1 MAG: selenocysteine-specific translation elongation factor [Pseudomonadota bacterium]
MRSLILGTAGHIDHGKTALVRKLTGIETDRLIEEKKRGITIELGFAHLELPGLRFGVVDVPGHERFIKSMVAGAGGIDLVMLVVAADEGVMPQTREHLDICQLLGVKRGLVALSKVDLVDLEWRELVQDDLRGALEGTFLEGAPIVPCSAHSGEGLDTLTATLERLARDCPDRERGGLLRLPLDRVFTIKGFGTVVTGTLLSGSLKTGDHVEVLPSEVTATVRRIQVHGQEEPQALAGQRTAVNLGGADRQEVARGEVLAHPKTFEASSILDAEISLLPEQKRPLKARTKVLFHLGTRQQEASCVLLEDKTLEPGEKALAQLSFDKPVISLPGDRFILRGFVKQQNYGTTLGGGTVLRVRSRRLRPRDKEAIALVARMRDAEPRERLALEVLAEGHRGLDRDQLAGRLPITPKRLDTLIGELLSKGEVARYDKERSALIHREPLEALEARTLQLVDLFHDKQPLERGVGREELRTRLGASLEPKLVFTLMARLERRGEITIDQDLVRRPDHEVRAGEAIEPLAKRMTELCLERRLQAPRDAELHELLDCTTQDAATAQKLLIDQGQLVKVGNLLFHPDAIATLEANLRDYLSEHESIDAPAFKTLVGQSRKFAIPLAEYFDAKKVTIRIGDARRLR